jgi:hypothetical protein
MEQDPCIRICPETAIPKDAKIKFKTLSYFSTPKECLFPDHVYHTIHHNFTTIYHHAAPQNPQKPLQNSHSTTPKLTTTKSSKKHPKSCTALQQKNGRTISQNDPAVDLKNHD